MKSVQSCAVAALLTLLSLSSSAQDNFKTVNEPDYNKAKIFSDLPQKMNLRLADMESLINLPIGSSVNTFAANNFRIMGTVVSKSDANDASAKTVVIKLNNRQGATLTFTRTTKADGTTSFIGRILNRNNGDAFEIVKENGQYVFMKKGVYDLISE